MDAKDLIAQGITLARRGQNEKAREMFNLALITEPRSEHAWLWLSTVAVDDAEKEDCLRQVLAINPKNVNAANELQKLGEKRRSELAAKVAALAAARASDRNSAGGSRGHARAQAAPGAGAAAAAQMPAWLKYAIIGGFGLLIVLIALGSFNLAGRVLNPVTPTITLDAVADGHHSADLDLHAHADGNPLPAARVHGDAHQHADDHSDAQRNADYHADANAHTYEYAHDPHVDAHAHADTDLYADVNSNAHTHRDSHADGHTYALAHGNTGAHPHGNGDRQGRHGNAHTSATPLLRTLDPHGRQVSGTARNDRRSTAGSQAWRVPSWRNSVKASP